MHEINVRGDGLHLTLWISGYEREPRGESYDDNWLRGSATLEVAEPPAAEFTATCAVAWTLSTLEDQVQLSIHLTAGKGTVAGRLEAHAVASLQFEATTDQSFLKQTLEELRQAIAAYPVRD